MWYFIDYSSNLFVIAPLVLWSLLIIVAIVCIIKSPVYRSPVVYITLIVAIFALICLIMSFMTAYDNSIYDFVVIPNEILTLIHSSLVAVPGLMVYQRLNTRSKEPDTWIIYFAYLWSCILIIIGIIHIGTESETYHDYRNYENSEMLHFIKCGNCVFVMFLLLFVALHWNTLSSGKAKKTLIASTLLYAVSIIANLTIYWVTQELEYYDTLTVYVITILLSELPMVLTLMLSVLFSHIWQLNQPSLKKKLKSESTINRYST
ncbi:uncharacterized protein EV154DRAFT_489429 [Mucor mucedo]|uniref:uncharacterized protein n=1 Tax=Mucor mucedo TaxID=29922 RepID=UPI00221ED014|nr:uncharacterized protein EV154DRAFT_489429 [Mucor mucedo]KAI7897244.1 hypothetical protein EV154DRAFT_489429 [Mucor mucedo]